MSLLPVVLDAAGLSAMALPGRQGADRSLFGILDAAWSIGREVLVPAVVCAEVCRGIARTRQVEALLARHKPGRKQQSPVSIVETDFALARLVGTVLEASKAGSKDMVDAHVVAVCVKRGGGMVVTSDPGDLHRLSSPFIGARIIVRTLKR